MSARPIDAVAAGHICLDITPSFPSDLGKDPAKIFVPGKLVNVGAPTLSTGGAVANAGLALLKLGLETRLVGKVANDSFGDTIRAIVREAGGGDSMAVVEGESSSYTAVIAPPGVDRIFFHSPATNDTFGPEDIDYDLLAQARLFHFGYPVLMARMYENGGKELIELLRRVKETGVTVSLDMAYPDPASPAGKADWESILQGALRYVDVFEPSIEELLYMIDRPALQKAQERAGGGDLTEHVEVAAVMRAADRVLAMGVKVALIKCGIRGLYLRTAGADAIAAMGAAAPDPAAWANRELWEVSFRVPVVSATGSGDTAIAGFLAALLKGETAARSLKIGVCVGGLSVQAAGATEGLKPWETTLAALDGMTEKLPYAFDGDGWSLDADTQTWSGPRDGKG